MEPWETGVYKNHICFLLLELLPLVNSNFVWGIYGKTQEDIFLKLHRQKELRKCNMQETELPISYFKSICPLVWFVLSTLFGWLCYALAGLIKPKQEVSSTYFISKTVAEVQSCTWLFFDFWKAQSWHSHKLISWKYLVISFSIWT